MKIAITTKTGDKGESSLANGERLPKSDVLFDVIGTLDELNSWLGLVAVKMGESFKDYKTYLYEIQDTLFYIGAELAQSPKAKLSQTKVDLLEGQAEALQTLLEDNWHTKFVLPGGTELGGYLDITRTVCRRMERLTFTYKEKHQVSPVVLQYVNRLSDYLYLLRCYVNQQEQYHEKIFNRKHT